MIHRADNRKFYTIVAGETVNDPELSTEALGLLVRMLALSDEWKFSVEGLECRFGLGESVILRLLKELKERGYLEIKRGKDTAGKFTKCEWHIYETRHNLKNHDVENHVTENHDVENHNVESHVVENPVDITNINRTNINRTNINKTNIKVTNNKEAHGEFKNVLLTSEQFDKLGERLGAEERDGLIEELSCYLQNHPRKYKDHYATVLTWARKKEKEPKPRPRPEPIKENPFTELLRKEGFL